MRAMPSLAAAGLAAAALVGSAAAPAGAGASLPVPTFTVTPSAYLFDLARVEAAWSNQLVGITEEAFGVWECLPGTFSGATCDLRGAAEAVASGSVVVTVSKTVHSTTCGTDSTQCSVRLVSDRGVEKGSVDIFFSAK